MKKLRTLVTRVIKSGIFVYFTNLVLGLDSDSDCKQCSSVLQELENIDDDAEVAGIPIVKLEDKLLAKTVGVFALPAIVFFRFFL